MDRTRSRPPSFEALLSRCTPAEAEAVGQYERNLGNAQYALAGRLIDSLTFLRRWAGEVRRLEEAGAGTPRYDDYVRTQRRRWIARREVLDVEHELPVSLCERTYRETAA